MGSKSRALPRRSRSRFGTRSATISARIFSGSISAAFNEIAAVPTVASASFDRAFPHTLRIVIVPEHPVAVLRQGAASWLVSSADGSWPAFAMAPGRGCRALGREGRGARTRRDGSGDAQRLTRCGGAASHHALPRAGLLRPGEPDELLLILRSGLELRLGDSTDVALKLAVAAQVSARRLGHPVRRRERSRAARGRFGLPHRRSAPAGSSTGSAATQSQRSTASSSPTTTLKSQLQVDGAGSTTP